ncbi:MAG: universal stress protein [Acidimicrobiia bacterium]
MADIIVLAERTATSADVVRFAHRLASAARQRVIAVEAVRNTSTEHTLEQERGYLGAEADDLRSRLPADLVQHIQVVTVDAEPIDALLEQAGHRDAAAVVIGSTGCEGVTGYGFGSPAHVLAHRLDCPLVVVPPSAAPGGDEVVVGIDGSPASDVALDTAARIAGELTIGLCAVYMVDDIYRTFTTHGYYGAQERLARAEVARRASPVRFVERFGDDPAEVLADVARRQRAVLLVVAARQQHALGGLLLGGVPDHLLHEPPCPVMVLPLAYVERAEQRLQSVGARHAHR